MPGRVLSFSIRWVLHAPWLLGVCSVAFVVSVGAVAGVVLLLARQLRVRAKGTTVLEEMRGGPGSNWYARFPADEARRKGMKGL